MAADRIASTTWEGPLMGGSGTVELRSSGVGSYPVTWPSRVEQPDGRTSPEELLAGSHATCFAMAFAHALAQAGNAAERLQVTATVTVAPKEGGGIQVTRSVLDVAGKVPGLDQAAFQSAAEQAELGCPISNAIRGNVPITVSATLSS